MKIFISLILTCCLFACNQKKNLTSSNAVTTNTEAKEMTFDNSCYKDRAVTKEVKDVEVEMVIVMDMFMFSFDNTRWQPCAVPAKFQKEGIKVKVSGEVLEIKPNERRAGTPFNIKSLSEIL